METTKQSHMVEEDVRSSYVESEWMRIVKHQSFPILTHRYTGCGEVVDNPTLRISLHNVPLNFVLLLNARLQHLHILLR